MIKKISMLIIFIVLIGSGGDFAFGKIHQKQTGLNKEPINSLIKTLKNYTLVKSINITDDTFPAIWWVPKSYEKQINIPLKLVTYLEQATLYEKEIPKSQKVIQHAGNIGPSQLYVLSTNNSLITVCPAYYVTVKNNLISVKYIKGVIEITNGKKCVYLETNMLYNWLKNNEWKADYKYMQ